MLARRLTTILPAMSLIEATDITWIHSIAGIKLPRAAFMTMRLLRAQRLMIVEVSRRGSEQKPMPESSRWCTEEASHQRFATVADRRLVSCLLEVRLCVTGTTRMLSRAGDDLERIADYCKG